MQIENYKDEPDTVSWKKMRKREKKIKEKRTTISWVGGTGSYAYILQFPINEDSTDSVFLETQQVSYCNLILCSSFIV